MIEIDGSYGEGGGQIVRTAVALSGVTGKPVRVFNIRANRPKPGLAAQHTKAIETVKLLTNADVRGLFVGSTDFSFTPGENAGGNFEIDIGTAGSITLLLQCALPVAVFSSRPTELKITGGTDVAWSPPFDFFRYIFLPMLAEMGAEVSVELLRRGYYPRGGGCIRVKVNPSGIKGLVLQIDDRREITGVSHSSCLPGVAQRQTESARKFLKNAGYNAKIDVEERNEVSTGSGITLWSGCKSGSALGEKGKRAEKVGEEAAAALLGEMRSGGAVGMHLADQIVPYMALASGNSGMTVRELTMHAKTNIWATQKFLDRKFEVKEEEGKIRVTVI